jgi:TetR/AcrR family transcriptional regulator
MTSSSQNPSAGRDETLQAATDLFAGNGFDAVSINAIASRAGTSKANVFHHFASKEALYLEVMRSACRSFSGALERLGDDGKTLDERVRHFVREDIELMRSQPERAHLIMREVLESGPCRGRALASEVFDEQFAQIVALFRSGQESGRLTPQVPPAMAASMLIACNVFMFQSRHVMPHLAGTDYLDEPQHYADLVARVLLDGLRGPASGWADQGSQE